MAQGRGIAAIVFLLCMLVLYSEVAHASTYMVGDASGWTYNLTNWPDGKFFKAGDILVFRYIPFTHNVLEAEEATYNTCIPTLRSRVHFSGNDYIQLVPGMNYFICGYPFHCQQGMKIAINAA